MNKNQLAFFENFKITSREKIFLDQYSLPTTDKEYISSQLKINNWKRGFDFLILHKEKAGRIPTAKLAFFFGEKILLNPSTWPHFSRKVLRIISHSLYRPRKGCLIVLVGVNGSGKSTLARKVLEQSEPLTKHLGIKQGKYYFGWSPEFFLTKCLSHIFKKKDKKIFSRDLK